MMTNELTIFIVAGTMGILIMAVFIIVFVVTYQRKKFKSELKYEQLKTKSEKEATLASFRGQENERQRIASDLHDDICASLTAVKMSMNFICEKLNEDKETREELVDIRDTLAISIENVRNISHNLMPYALSKLGLSRSVQQLVESISNPPQFETSFSMSGQSVEIAEEVKLMLFRSIQEIISNCIKHSQATKLTVAFNWKAKELEIYTNDNGCGFDYEYNRNDLNKGLGLRNLESRFSIINAKHEVKSGNYGTTYLINLPLN